MDDIDRAQAREEMDRDLAIAAARKNVLLATGECHNCGATVPDGWCFCDADCRDDYEREIAARRREGLHK
jgi:hypothetical protein